MKPSTDRMALDADSPVRSAALLLHALGEPDRLWLLQRLHSEDSATLRPMLVELGQMGIPADRSLVRGLLQEASFLDLPQLGVSAQPVREGVLPKNAEADLVDWLSQVAPIALAEVLRSEPPQAIAHLLLLADWPWRAQLLARLGPGIRGRVESTLSQLQCNAACIRAASALRASLLKQVCRRLEIYMSSKQWAILRGDRLTSGKDERRGWFAGAVARPRTSWTTRLSKLRLWR